MKIYKIICAMALMSLIVSGCGQRGSVAESIGNDSIVTHARLLKMTEAEGYTRVDVYMPGDSATAAWQYALVPRGADVTLAEGLTRVDVPLQRSIVYSTVHTTAINELAKANAIVAVADGRYFAADDPISGMLKSGRIVDVGSSMAPSIEQIIDLNVDAILLSPIEGGTLGGVERTGVPLIFMADYLEATPLGRAEWIKLLGRLYGCAAQADSIYLTVEEKYNTLKSRAMQSTTRPKTVTERPFDGVWYVPGGCTYMARMLADAGAEYAWADDSSTGSLALDEAAVIDKASDAEVWLVKDGTTHTEASLLAVMPHARAFSAFPQGVYSADGRIFRDIAFHPELILEDFVTIFHPEIGGDTLRYFAPLQP